MNSQDSETRTDFHIPDPLEVFQTVSAEESERRRLIEPGFDAALHQEARELVIARLRAARSGRQKSEGAA